MFCVELVDEMLNQNRNILRSCSQGRESQRNDVQPVVEILAQPAIFDCLERITIGCGENANVEFEFIISAQSADTAVR